MTPTPDTTTDPGSQAWTSRRLLDWMGTAFAERGLDSPRLVAEMLLAHVIGCDRMRLYMEADRPASPEEREQLRAFVARALRHEPVQYLTGEAWFFSLPFTVDRRVLIPRPSTATIVEEVLQRARTEAPPATIADVCTGSGCLAIALLRNLPEARCLATDLSPDALDVARLNAGRLGVTERIQFRQGDLLAPLGDHTFDLLVANPPYIPDHEWPDVAPNVRDHEPHQALRASPDGLTFVFPVIEGAAARLRPGGRLFVEIASCTAEAVMARAATLSELQDATILDDFEGLPRVFMARRAGPRP
ncbi:MAG: peptide chain release factor N(5)-glutamine methyltransferase [Phycisphaerales bacterium]|nr:peptide chain release factor N(5)-glutamine methyltransferase [Phycisphaerales bacterium]